MFAAMSSDAEFASRSTGANTSPLTADPMACNKKAAPRSRRAKSGRLLSCGTGHGSSSLSSFGAHSKDHFLDTNCGDASDPLAVLHYCSPLSSASRETPADRSLINTS